MLRFPENTQGLQWLRCGVYPLAAALAFARANAATLEELQLVAASKEPYGCPDLARELHLCALNKLTRLVLLRQSGYDAPCRHDERSCTEQKGELTGILRQQGKVICSECDEADFRKSDLS